MTDRRDLNNERLVRISSDLVRMGLLHSFEIWLDRKLKNGTYALEGSEIVAGRGRRPDQRIFTSEVSA